jgi:uncharacterized protein (DUF433 family)
MAVVRGAGIMKVEESAMKLIDPEGFVFENEHGSWRVIGTRVMMELVVQAYNEGKSPEEIVKDYPSLTVDKVNGVVAFYLKHRELVERRMESEKAEFEQARQENEKNLSEAGKRIRRLLQERAAKK